MSRPINWELLVWPCSCVIRLVLLVYGEYQDTNFAVKYTDVDYRVFTDATRHLSAGRSPYQRETYRYTPLLAVMMLPNVFLFESFGKVLFSIIDVLTGYVIYRYFIDVLKRNPADSIRWTCLWLFNPFIFLISTRGSADCLMSFMMCLILYLLARQKYAIAGTVYAIAIIFKIFPVVCALAIYLNMQLSCKPKLKAVDFKISFKKLLPNFNSFLFGIWAAFFLFSLLILTYMWFGYEAIFETYLYHLVRKDTKHNFSPFFLMYYLSGSDETSSIDFIESKAISFLPLALQSLCLAMIAKKFYHNLPLCFFFSIFSFVNLNKVCTSQYFVWYLTFLPFVGYHLKVTLKRALFLAIIWLAAQSSWLFPAYLLEFQGINTFEYIWIASLIFFSANMFILQQSVQFYNEALIEKLK